MNPHTLSANSPAVPTRWELYKGWFLGVILIVSVLAVGAGFWLRYHP